MTLLIKCHKKISNPETKDKTEEIKPVHFMAKQNNTGYNATYKINLEKSFLGDEIGVYNSKGDLLSAGIIKRNTAVVIIYGDNPITVDTIDGAIENQEIRFIYWHKDSNREVSLKLNSVSEIITKVDFDTIAVYQNNGLFEISAEVVNLIPTEIQLAQNYPNPFNPNTKIRFAVPESGRVKVDIFNILGQQLDILVNEVKEAGYYEINFENRNLASGVYFYRIEFKKRTLVKK
jgi:hypothetical protein